jgi:DNA-binding winged helix-turn-helix (wHTH) protein
MLKLGDLALRPDLQLGPMLVSPSRRLVEGPGGHTHTEPLIMQVFLLLLDAGGKVVTRNELFDQCWGGVIVGDDSLNRAIAKVRRIGAQVAPGLYEIETIPRTGYRMTGEILGLLNGASTESRHGPAVSRRRAILAGSAAAAAAAGAGAWWFYHSPTDPRFDAIMARGDEAMRNGSAFEPPGHRADRNIPMVDLYTEAVRLEPGSARAWGLLGYFRAGVADEAPPKDSARLVANAQSAIRRALDIDPEEPNARVAMFLLEGRMLDWLERENRLRAILARDPNNLLAMMELMPLLQAAGMTRESWSWNERILKISPMAQGYLCLRAMKLWILGRVRESDNVIDRVRGLWPGYSFAFWVRFLLFAQTDRPRAARTMLDAAPERLGDAEYVSIWRTILDALETRTPRAITAARSACLELAKESPVSVNDMVMTLCGLGLKEDAFEVTQGFLLWRGKILSTDQADGKKMDDYSRRMTQWLFTPPCAIMREDPRFEKLCDDFGLTDYWRARGMRPDYQVYR